MKLRHLASLSLCSGLLGCAVTINHTDVFSANDAHVSSNSVEIPLSVSRSSVQEVSLSVGGRRYLGYRLVSEKPARAVLFMPGNGYGASRALSRLASAFFDESTDLYVVSYAQPGESPPLVSEVFTMAQALAAHASATSSIPKSRLVGVGHSLGGWVALNLASKQEVGCAVVVGSGTTAAATASRVIKPQFLSSALSFKPDDDVALLDNERQARKVLIPTLIVGSELDEIMPATSAQAIYRSLPEATSRQLFLSSSASHGGYFRDQMVVKEIQAFMHLKCDA